MTTQLRAMNNDGKVARAPDGEVGPYSFWLGNLFEADDSDGEDLGDDSEADQQSFRFD